MRRGALAPASSVGSSCGGDQVMACGGNMAASAAWETGNVAERNWNYPLVNKHLDIGNYHKLPISRWFPYWKWWCSISKCLITRWYTETQRHLPPPTKHLHLSPKIPTHPQKSNPWHQMAPWLRKTLKPPGRICCCCPKKKRTWPAGWRRRDTKKDPSCLPWGAPCREWSNTRELKWEWGTDKDGEALV